MSDPGNQPAAERDTSSNDGALRRLLAEARPHRMAVCAAVACVAVGAAGSLTVPWLATGFVRGSVVEGRPEAHAGLLGLVIAAAAAGAFGRFGAELLMLRTGAAMVAGLRARMAAKILRLPAGRAGEPSRIALTSRILHDVQAAQNFLYDVFFAAGGDLLVVAGAVIGMVAMAPQLALLCAAAVPAGAVLLRITAGALKKRTTAAQEAVAAQTVLLAAQAGSLPEIRAFNSGPAESRRAAEAADLVGRTWLATNALQLGTRATVNFVGTAVVVVLMGWGVTLVRPADGPAVPALSEGPTRPASPAPSGPARTPSTAPAPATDPSDPGAGGNAWWGGPLTLDRLVGFGLFALTLAEPLTRLSKTHLELAKTRTAAARVFELLDRPEEPDDTGLPPSEPMRGEIRFEGVRFAHPDGGGAEVLRGVDLTFTPGGPVALVGGSGAGKTTLLQLAMRLLRPTAGRVLIDGADAAGLHGGRLRDRIGWAGAEPFLPAGAAAGAVCYGLPEGRDASPARVAEALRLARADDLLAGRTGDAGELLGERGAGLSAGQRARLALARVILRDPAIVLLDEATATIDAETEGRIREGLRGWMDGRTVVICSHRLSTVMACPRAVVLEGGTVVADGPPGELAVRSPAFQRLFADQMRGR